MVAFTEYVWAKEKEKLMGKKIQRLPDSELDIMLALWNGHPEMTRMEIEAFVNRKKGLAPTLL